MSKGNVENLVVALIYQPSKYLLAINVVFHLQFCPYKVPLLTSCILLLMPLDEMVNQSTGVASYRLIPAPDTVVSSLQHFGLVYTPSVIMAMPR